MTIISTIHSSWHVWPYQPNMEHQKMKPNIFGSKGCISNFIMFVCTLTTIPNCRSVLQSCFHCGSFHMDNHTVLYIGVGLAQAHPNYVINNYLQLCIYHYVAWVSAMPWTVKLQRLQSLHIRLTQSTISWTSWYYNI